MLRPPSNDLVPQITETILPGGYLIATPIAAEIFPCLPTVDICIHIHRQTCPTSTEHTRPTRTITPNTPLIIPELPRDLLTRQHTRHSTVRLLITSCHNNNGKPLGPLTLLCIILLLLGSRHQSQWYPDKNHRQLKPHDKNNNNSRNLSSNIRNLRTRNCSPHQIKFK